MDTPTTKTKRSESKRMQWTKDSMDNALQAVKDGQAVSMEYQNQLYMTE